AGGLRHVQRDLACYRWTAAGAAIRVRARRSRLGKVAAPRVFDPDTAGSWMMLPGVREKPDQRLPQNIGGTRLIDPQGFGIADAARLPAVARDRLLRFLSGIAAAGFIGLVGDERHQLTEPFHRRRPVGRDIDKSIRLEGDRMPRAVVVVI